MATQFKPVGHVIKKLISIPNKRGEIVPFELNNIQQHFHDHRKNRNDVLKFRQGGMTSFIMAWFLIECLYKYTRAVMIAHDKDHTEKLLARVHFFLKTLKGPKPQTGKVNEQEIGFSKTGASFTIGTAGSKTFGRSDTITHLHCSETAFWKDPRTLITGLFGAVPHDSGVIIKESTANGYGTYHHQEFMRAYKGQGRFQALFYPWHIFEEYQSRTPLTSELNEEEIRLVEEFNLTPEQIQWRREKLEDEFGGNEDSFRQEYPLTMEEAFRVTGGSLFPRVLSTENTDFVQVHNPYGPGKMGILNPHPIEGYHYAFGVDTGGGTGGDNSTIQGICIETMEQVLAYRVNTLWPPDFAQVVIGLGNDFNLAYLVPEQNQHGLSVISVIKNELPYINNLHLIYKTKISPKRPMTQLQLENPYGFKTAQMSKYKLIGNLQIMLKDIILYDPVTVDQLRGFGETDMGVLGNLATGGHDDDVIALGLALEGVRKRLLYFAGSEEAPKKKRKPGERPPFVIDLEDIQSRVKGSSSGSYFENHVVPHVQEGI